MIKDGVTLAAYVCLDKKEITVLNIEILRRAGISIPSTSPPLCFSFPHLLSHLYTVTKKALKSLKAKHVLFQANPTLVELNKTPNQTTP